MDRSHYGLTTRVLVDHSQGCQSSPPLPRMFLQPFPPSPAAVYSLTTGSFRRLLWLTGKQPCLTKQHRALVCQELHGLPSSAPCENRARSASLLLRLAELPGPAPMRLPIEIELSPS